ncbi:SDR family oxidoreductase [Streptomyces sp. MUM 203J]|uniref:SDR family NAD(P)-dependent oxidoreductase n=1 Tax=Streptomyces sp. MUM 203J TaxID=2791990 RepID=UPI001F034E4C|nr:SDR family oxidoreductase [Streptomyces sp. MUM 203J]MCH0540292.1 SDR family oxidoreductase [Streptomyces sp. MUM 203J]
MTENRVALVTGSSSGIGAAIAARLAAEGMRLVINSSRSPEKGRELAAELPDAHYVQADVSDEADAVRLVDAVIERYGRLDVLVNSAGVTQVIPHADIAAVTPEVWQRILGVNVIGTWQVIQAAAPHLAKAESGAGSVVTISSVAGNRPVGSSIPYAVSKAALDHMTRLLAAALGPHIRVNSVAPALTETPWTRDNPFFQKIAEKVREETPLRRVGTDADVAEAVLAAVRNPHMTGAVIPVDGGAALI